MWLIVFLIQNFTLTSSSAAEESVESVIRGIMKEPAFQQIDQELSSAYAIARESLSHSDQDKLRTEQRSWTRRRDEMVFKSRPDERLSVALNQTRSRLVEVRNYGRIAEKPTQQMPSQAVKAIKDGSSVTSLDGSLAPKQINELYERLTRNMDFSIADKELNEVYSAIKKKLNPDQAKAFQQSQKRWLSNLYEQIVKVPEMQKAAFAVNATKGRIKALTLEKDRLGGIGSTLNPLVTRESESSLGQTTNPPDADISKRSLMQQQATQVQQVDAEEKLNQVYKRLMETFTDEVAKKVFEMPSLNGSNGETTLLHEPQTTVELRCIN